MVPRVNVRPRVTAGGDQQIKMKKILIIVGIFEAVMCALLILSGILRDTDTLTHTATIIEFIAVTGMPMGVVLALVLAIMGIEGK